MGQTEAVTVRRLIVVDAPIERAFEVFTGRFGDFKPPEHNLLGAQISQTVFEPRVGGNIVDRATDGSECRWARILNFDPPDRVVFSWDISPQWTVETDPAQTSEVATGTMIYRIRERKRWREFLSFLKILRARWPGGRLCVICDNYGPHQYPDVRTWAAGHNIELVYLPTSASWLN